MQFRGFKGYATHGDTERPLALDSHLGEIDINSLVDRSCGCRY